MKTVILCGGLGTRLAEETDKIPKPIVKIGKIPIIHHIINYYMLFGFNDFILCAGYKHKKIFDYFKNFKNIKVVNTGLNSQTGARIKKIRKLINKNEDFFMTYGDGLSNINLKLLLKFHRKHKKIATLSSVRPIPRFGKITLSGSKIIKFEEKSQLREGWINGGFFVLNYRVFNYINNKEDCIFEKEPLQKLSKNSQLMAFKHHKFWHPMDTLRDKRYLNSLLKLKKAPWIK